MDALSACRCGLNGSPEGNAKIGARWGTITSKVGSASYEKDLKSHECDESSDGSFSLTNLVLWARGMVIGSARGEGYWHTLLISRRGDKL